MQEFTRLWLESHDAVAGYIYVSIRDFHEAEDVLQEVARSAAGSFDRYDRGRPFVAWLIGIAKLRVADYYRWKGRQPPLLSTEAMEDLASAQTQMALEADGPMAALQKCLSQLNERHRQAIELRYGRSMTPEQIAAQAGVKPSAINAQIYRIRQALADCITRQLDGGRA